MTCTSPILDNDVPASQCSTRTGGRLNAPSRARGSPAAATAPPPALLEFVELPPLQAPILVTEASGQHFQDPAPAKPPKLYPPLPVSTDKKGRETLELSRGCALPESRRERKRTDKRFAMLAAALGKSISGPPKNLLCPRDRKVLHPVQAEAPGPVTDKPVCPVPSFWPVEE